MLTPLATRALGSQALKALLQWLVVLAVFQAFLDGHPHLLQKVFHRMGHAPRSRRGHQTHAGNAGDLGAPTGLAVQQWAAHHYLGIDAFKPSQETWKHHFLGIAMLQRPREKIKHLSVDSLLKWLRNSWFHFMINVNDPVKWNKLWLLGQKSFNYAPGFTHDLLDFTHSYHQRVIFQAVFLGDICQGSKPWWQKSQPFCVYSVHLHQWYVVPCCTYSIHIYIYIYILLHIIIFYYILFYFIISYYILLYFIISYYILLYPIISYYILLYPIISYYILLYTIISYVIPLYPIIYCYISYDISYYHIYYHILSYLIAIYIYYPMISYSILHYILF